MTQLPIPRIREADPAIVAGLREVDPTTEMIYLQDGRWDILRLRPKNDYRMTIAARTFAAAVNQTVKAGGLPERTWYRRLRLYRMAMMGYSFVTSWTFQGDPDWRVVKDYRERAWKLRHDVAYDDDETDRIRAADEMRKELLDPSRAREASRALRNPVTFTYNKTLKPT